MTAGAARLKELMAVANDGTGEKRRTLLREITDIIAATPTRFTPTEMQQIDTLMCGIVDEVETRQRQTLAETFADALTAPKGLMRLLALDEISVADPVLKRSRALSEDDLVEIVRQRGPDHMRAILKRRHLPEKLTAELVERGDEETLIALAENAGARFSRETMANIVARARVMKPLQKPMVERFDLPAQSLTKMYFFCPAPLKMEILKRSDLLDPALIDDAVTSNRGKIAKGAAREAAPDIAAAYQFIQEQADNGEIDEAFLVDLVKAKRHGAFLLAFAYLAGVDPETGRAILKDRTGEPLAIACRSAGFEKPTFELILTSMLQSDDKDFTPPRIVDLYLKVPPEAAERVMRFWRVSAHAPASVQNETPARRRPKLHELGMRAVS